MADTVQQNFRMLQQMAGLSLHYPPRTISVLAFLLLAHFCRGQSQLFGAPKPIVATVGDDIILPCHLKPTEDVAAKTLEWTRPNLNPRFVFVWRAGQDLENVKNPSYKGRTSLFPDELKQGNMSLKLSKVNPSDAGRYKCYIPDMNIDSFIELVVGAVSLPIISLAGIDRDKGGVVLQCESEGWYPEPEVLWLDGEGSLLSAGPTESVRGPDDLYTVSSRVTVEKRQSNSFTCRVQQKNTNQTRESEIQFSDDFFEIQSSSSVPINTGLAVSLAVFVILFVVLLLFSVWKWRQNKINTKISHRDGTDPSVTAEDTEALTGEQVNQLLAEVKELKEEKQSIEKERQKLQKELEDKIKELEEKAALSLFERKIVNKQTLEEEQQKREEAEKQVQILTQKLDEEEKQRSENQQEQLQKELEDKIKKVDDLSAEVKELKEEKQKRENEQEQLQKDLEDKRKQVNELSAEVKELKDEKQRTENERKQLQKEMEDKIKELDARKMMQLGNSQKYQENDTCVTSQDSDKGHIVVDEVDPEGKYVRLYNKSKTDQEIKSWELYLHVNNRKPIIYTFRNSLKLKAGETVKIWASGCGVNNDTSTDLVWKGQKPWDTGEQLLVSLYSSNGELEARKISEGRIIVNEVDLEGKYVRLTNKSNKDKRVEGWELHLQINNRKPSMYTFFDSFILKTGETVTIWASGCCVNDNSPTDLVWKDQKPWDTGEQLRVSLYSCNGELEASKILEPEKSQGLFSRQTCQGSAKGPIIVDEVDPEGIYVRLCNTCNADQRLHNCELHIRVNNRKPIVHTFNNADVLKARMTFNVEFSEKRWATGDQLLVSLYNYTGKEIATKKVGL